MIKTKNNLIRRIFTILLCSIIIIPNISITTHAVDPIQISVNDEASLMTAISNAGSTPIVINVEDNITFSLVDFMKVPIKIPESSDVTIRPLGKNISFKKVSGDCAIFNVKSGGKLTIESNGKYTLTIDGQKIDSNTPTITVSGSLSLNNVDVTGNCFKNGTEGQINGGAISLLPKSTCNIDGGKFSENHSEECGGTIYCNGATLNLANATFYKNTASSGGAVDYRGASQGVIENCTFSSNITVAAGGALYIADKSDITIKSGVFEKNSSLAFGGAIYTDGNESDLFMNRVLFDSNAASENGGAIWHCAYGTAHYYTYSGMLFWNNTAENAGADMYLAEAEDGFENGGEYSSDKTYTGIPHNWCYDTQSNRFDSNNPIAITDQSYYQGSNLLVAMKSNITEADYLAAKDEAVIIFKGNTANEGGALSNNGFVEIGYKSGLTIEKQVTGTTNAPSDDVFKFTVTFSDNQTYDGVKSGSIVSLKNGEKKLISNVPKEISVQVSEVKIANYTPIEKEQTTVIGEYGSELLFVNKYSNRPNTGDTTNTNLWLNLMMCSLIIITIIVIYNRKHRYSIKKKTSL